VTRKTAPSRKASKAPAKGHAKAAPRSAPAPKKVAAKPVHKPTTKAPPKTAVKPPLKQAPKAAPKPAPKPMVAAPQQKAPLLGKDGKPLRKGITIVSPKPMKRPRPKAVPIPMPAGMGQLLGKGNSGRKPLIPSGPHATPLRPLGLQHGDAGPDRQAHKTPFNKKELEKFRAILLRKRAELVGDISTMENEALKGESGSLSNLPQHIAEQGSEAYEQSLALDLAAADRKLIKEIDDALKRIDNGSYGVCELTGKPIKAERLEELPWARYSIEAARELERRSMRA
jgi:RNA polymerase-binding protein DksA